MCFFFCCIKNIKPKNEQVVSTGDVVTLTGKKKTNYFAIFTSGFLINTLNPAVIAFWVAMAVSLSADYNFNQRIIIFVTCLGVNILADSSKVLGAGSLGKKLSHKNILRIN